MGGSPCFPCSPVSEHRCGGSGERAQPGPRFLSTCSFLQRTMTGRPASHVTVAEHAENPFPSRRGGKNTPTQGCTAAAVKSLSPAAAKLPESSSGCAPALSGVRRKTALCRSLYIFYSKKHWFERKPARMCSFLGSLLLFPPCKGIVLVQNIAGDLTAVFWVLGWGGYIIWLILIMSPNTLTSSSTWNEIKCTLHRNFLQAFFDFLFNNLHQIKTTLNGNSDTKQ